MDFGYKAILDVVVKAVTRVVAVVAGCIIIFTSVALILLAMLLASLWDGILHTIQEDESAVKAVDIIKRMADAMPIKGTSNEQGTSPDVSGVPDRPPSQ